MMTSDAKDNHMRLESIMGAFNWFGRGSSAFRCAVGADMTALTGR